jgi:hypothetical protein
MQLTLRLLKHRNSKVLWSWNEPNRCTWSNINTGCYLEPIDFPIKTSGCPGCSATAFFTTLRWWSTSLSAFGGGLRLPPDISAATFDQWLCEYGWRIGNGPSDKKEMCSSRLHQNWLTWIVKCYNFDGVKGIFHHLLPAKKNQLPVQHHHTHNSRCITGADLYQLKSPTQIFVVLWR